MSSAVPGTCWKSRRRGRLNIGLLIKVIVTDGTLADGTIADGRIAIAVMADFDDVLPICRSP